MELGAGLAQGLAYRHDWNSDIQRLQSNGERIRQAKADAEAKMNYYREKFKMPPMDNDYDRGRVEGLITDTIQEVKTFERENPNWKYSLEGQLQFEKITNKIVNNEFTMRNGRVKSSYDQFRKDAVDGKINTAEIDKYETQWTNYNKYGNINGPNDMGEVQEFNYVQPKKADLNAQFKTYADMGSKDVFGRKGNLQYTYKYLSDQDALIQATTMYSEMTEDIDIAYQNLSPHLKEMYKTELEWVTANIKARAKSDISNVIADPIIRDNSDNDSDDKKNNNNQVTPYRTNIYAPYIAKEKQGSLGAVTPFMQIENDNIVSHRQSFMKMGNVEVPFNLKNRKVTFSPAIGSSKITTTQGDNGSNVSRQTSVIDSYDDNGTYTWKRHYNGTSDDNYAYYPVKMTKDQFDNMILTTGDPDNIKKVMKDWYNLNKVTKKTNSGVEEYAIFDIGTPMDVQTNIAAEDKYNNKMGLSNKTQQYGVASNSYQGFNLNVNSNQK